jgi:hypothetical protein
MRSVAAILAGLLVCLAACGAFCSSAHAERSPGATEKTARIALVREFVREVEVLYRLQETAKKELAENSSTAGQLTTSIRVGTRTLFEMQESVSRLDMISLDTRWGEFRDLLKSFHNQRMATVQELIQMSKALLSGPEPGVNYGAMTASRLRWDKSTRVCSRCRRPYSSRSSTRDEWKQTVICITSYSTRKIGQKRSTQSTLLSADHWMTKIPPAS